MFYRLKRWWHLRSMPIDELKSLNEIVVKSGRRVSYDLVHAVQVMKSLNTLLTHYLPKDTSGYEPDIIEFEERSHHWLSIFSLGDGGKNYRTKLGSHISELEREVKRLEKICEDHNIKHQDPNKIPF